MDPDFFEVVMGADGTLKFVPVTDQALRSRSHLRKGRERLPGMAPIYRDASLEKEQRSSV